VDSQKIPVGSRSFHKLLLLTLTRSNMKNYQELLYDCFNGKTTHPPLFMPDLNTWYQWHKKRGTLPEEIKTSTITEIANRLNCPAWLVQKPWEVEYQGVTVSVTETDNEKIILYETPYRTLREKWIIGPDGDWWQEEYPLKTIDDFDAAEFLVDAKTYVVNSDANSMPEGNAAEVVALQLPMTPYSEMLHSMLGWGDGLLLIMGQGRSRLGNMLEVLEKKHIALVEKLASHPGLYYLLPDNLDGQYISPATFKSYFAASYQATAKILHNNNKKIIVHLGGIGKHLLPLISSTGIDAVLGVSGPPQSNATLSEAREIVGEGMVLWGGIPQSLLMNTHDEKELEQSVQEALLQATKDTRVVIGVADHVPVGTDFSRLQRIAQLISKGR
jgi:hypothetical protein